MVELFKGKVTLVARMMLPACWDVTAALDELRPTEAATAAQYLYPQQERLRKACSAAAQPLLLDSPASAAENVVGRQGPAAPRNAACCVVTAAMDALRLAELGMLRSACIHMTHASGRLAVQPALKDFTVVLDVLRRRQWSPHRTRNPMSMIM